MHMTVKLVPGQGMYANAYVARKTVLVDAGVTPMAVEAHKVKILYIILTHCHYDHIAYLSALIKMTGAKVLIHEADANGLLNDNKSVSLLFGAHAPGIVPDVILHDGDRIEGLEVIHTPGHTPGSICLYDPETFELISGDTVFTDGGYGRFDFPGGSRLKLINSLNKLGSLKVSGLYPGHGLPVTENGDKHIRAANTLIMSDYE